LFWELRQLAADAIQDLARLTLGDQLFMTTTG
jgi:hypothetical protein